MSKGRYIARICYDEDFKKEVDKFIQLIYLDKKLEALAKKNPNQRFSAYVRWLIKVFNDKRGPDIIEAAKIQK